MTLPDALAAPFLFLDKLQARFDRGGEQRRAGRGVDVGASALQHRFHHLRGARDECARHARRLAERSDVDDTRGAQAEIRGRAAAFRPDDSEAVRVVYEKPGIVAIAQIEHHRQRRDVAVHAEYAVGDDQPRARPRIRQRSFEKLEIHVRIPHHPGARQAHAVDEGRVIQRVGKNRIFRAGERGNRADVCLVAAGKKQRARHLHEF